MGVNCLDIDGGFVEGGGGNTGLSDNAGGLWSPSSSDLGILLRLNSVSQEVHLTFSGLSSEGIGTLPPHFGQVISLGPVLAGSSRGMVFFIRFIFDCIPESRFLLFRDSSLFTASITLV